MERLTHYDEDGRIYSSRGWETTLSRLAAYEDTGLEPEEIKQMCALARLNSNIFDNDFGNHIAELIVAERDGRLVVLPCKVGDTVYKANKASRKVNPWVVNAIYFSSNMELIIDAGRGGKHFTLGMFGKTVFLTSAEAEAVLAGEGEQDARRLD